MKYPQIQTLEKAIFQEGASFCFRVFVVLCSHPAERKKVMDRIAFALHNAFPQASLSIRDAQTTPLGIVMEELSTRPLLSDALILQYEGVEKLSKKEGEILAQYASSPSSFVHLILGASALKNHPLLKQEVALLDFSEEKPWERQQRLKSWLIEEAHKEGKMLEPSLVSHLMEGSGFEWASLEQEMVKLICFVGERKQIELGDALEISSTHSHASGWQLAETLVWGEPSPSKMAMHDSSMLFPLLGQLRYHLELGLQMAVLINQKQGEIEELRRFFPHLKLPQLEKYVSLAKRRKGSFFQEGLCALFELELGCRGAPFTPSMLWDVFQAKLIYLRSQHD